jgi:II/X family phage/plasmid replication protein
MIDWVAARIPCVHRLPITGGKVLSIDEGGAVEWQTDKFFDSQGSYSTSVKLRSDPASPPGTVLQITGNPVKRFQGHNLWGTSDLVALVYQLMRSLASIPELHLSPSPEDVEAWRTGDYDLTRVDVTESFRLPTEADVLAWIRAAQHGATLPYRGRGEMTKGNTLYFGKNSRRWALKLYGKHSEATQKNGKTQPALRGMPEAVEWTKGILRAELVLRSMELKRRSIATASAWSTSEGVIFNPQDLLRDALGSMHMTTMNALPLSTLAELPPRLRVVVQAWEAGSDLRQALPHRTFYRYRSQLLPFGIDIHTVVPKEHSNVVPLMRVLEAVPAAIPAWAYGTPAYFEPVLPSRAA